MPGGAATRCAKQESLLRRDAAACGYGNALSPRELEVARLASQGLSNSRIAAALTLSVSTVEDHLSHAMRKLEVRSRHDLGPLISP